LFQLYFQNVLVMFRECLNLFSFTHPKKRIMAEKRTNKREWQRTITLELHEAWKQLRRIGDPELMAKELGYSRPVIDRALIYGYVSMPELTDLINKFFKDRLERERTEAAAMLKLQDQVKKAKS